MWKYFIYFCAVQSKLNFWAYIWLKYPSVTTASQLSLLSYALNLNNAQIDSLKIALIKIKHYGSPKYYFHCTLKGWIEDKTGCVYLSINNFQYYVNFSTLLPLLLPATSVEIWTDNKSPAAFVLQIYFKFWCW